MAQTVSTDPGAINAAVASLDQVAEVKVTTTAPSNNEVTLPGGYINREGALVKYAEVRELNGADEETIARSGTTGRALNSMLQRGLVNIGMDPAQKEDLENLLSGDRDAILLGIRKATFGKTIDFEFTCPNCKEHVEVTIDLEKDIPTKELENPIEDRKWFYVSEKWGNIGVGLPNGMTQRKLLENSDKTAAEMNTILLAGCVISVGESPSMGASTVLKLSWKDREKIVEEILERNPGPRLGEVKKGCESCGEEIPMPLTLAALFRV